MLTAPETRREETVIVTVSEPLNTPGPISALEPSRHGPFHTLLGCSISVQNRVPGCELDLKSGTWPAMTLELSPGIAWDHASCEGPKLS